MNNGRCDLHASQALQPPPDHRNKVGGHRITIALSLLPISLLLRSPETSTLKFLIFIKPYSLTGTSLMAAWSAFSVVAMMRVKKHLLALWLHTCIVKMNKSI